MLIIRPATLSDLHIVIKYSKDLHDFEQNLHCDNTVRDTSDQIQSYINEGQIDMICYNELEVGYTYITNRYDKSINKTIMCIHELFIDLDYMRIVFGTDVLTKILLTAEIIKQVDSVQVKVLRNNLLAIHVYEKVGFIKQPDLTDGYHVLLEKEFSNDKLTRKD